MVHIDQEEMAQEKDTRKGPWTEQEDMQLDFFVRLFGERRWDFIAKVSGLNRTGKSCRLRWVNYLHPGLKRGKLSPQEERLVLELHSKWGNRWSRIARKLPGRTDNEIKNYWRTHMRKKAQQRKRNFSSSSSSSSILDSLSSATTPLMDSAPLHSKSERGKKMDNSEYGASSAHVVTGLGGGKEEEANFKAYSMDQIWKEISSTEILSDIGDENFRFDGGTFACPSMAMASPLWDYQYGDQSAWRMDDEELKHWLPTGDHIASNYQRA